MTLGDDFYIFELVLPRGTYGKNFSSLAILHHFVTYIHTHIHTYTHTYTHTVTMAYTRYAYGLRPRRARKNR